MWDGGGGGTWPQKHNQRQDGEKHHTTRGCYGDAVFVEKIYIQYKTVWGCLIVLNNAANSYGCEIMK